MNEDDLNDLNRKFLAGTLVSTGCYLRLAEAGITPTSASIIRIFPDGGATVFGFAILRSGRLLEFDVDPDSASDTTVTDRTTEFSAVMRNSSVPKNWRWIFAAFDTLQQMGRLDTVDKDPG